MQGKEVLKEIRILQQRSQEEGRGAQQGRKPQGPGKNDFEK